MLQEPCRQVRSSMTQRSIPFSETTCGCGSSRQVQSTQAHRHSKSTPSFADPMFGLQYGQIEYGSGTLTARTSAVGSLVMTGSVQAAAALTAQSIGTILMLGSFHYASVAV